MAPGAPPRLVRHQLLQADETITFLIGISTDLVVLAGLGAAAALRVLRFVEGTCRTPPCLPPAVGVSEPLRSLTPSYSQQAHPGSAAFDRRLLRSCH